MKKKKKKKKTKPHQKCIGLAHKIIFVKVTTDHPSHTRPTPGKKSLTVPTSFLGPPNDAHQVSDHSEQYPKSYYTFSSVFFRFCPSSQKAVEPKSSCRSSQIYQTELFGFLPHFSADFNNIFSILPWNIYLTTSYNISPIQLQLSEKIYHQKRK